MSAFGISGVFATMFTIHISSILRTESASLTGSGITDSYGNGTLIIADISFDLSESIIIDPSG